MYKYDGFVGSGYNVQIIKCNNSCNINNYSCYIYSIFINFSLPEIIAGICFVGALFGVSITFKCIGIGDVIVTFIVILIKGTVFAVFSFTMATLLLGIVNFIRLVKKKISVKSEIPFVPYLGICAMVTALCM